MAVSTDVDLSRRDLMKTTAATGAAVVGVSASSGPTSAQSATSTAANAAKLGMMVSPTGFAVVGVYTAIVGLRSPNEDLIARNNLHQSAVAEQQSWDGHLVQFENRLEDAAMVAHIESRDAIARSYEDGASAADALTNMNSRVSNWYADAPEHNVLEIANKVLLSLHAIAQDGANTDPVFYVMASGMDSNDNGYNVVISPESDGSVENHTVTLHNGDEHEIGNGVVGADDNDVENPTTPLIEIWEDTGSGGYPEGTKVGEMPLLSDEILDTYDPDAAANAEFELTLDDGTVVESDLTFGIPGIADNEDVNPETVFNFSEVAELLTEISDQSDLVVGQYDKTFVQDLYGLMDDGTLDPNDIRGSAGMAQFLSGTDDASESRFQLALMQQLGVGRSDLSEVASMTIEYTGHTSRQVDRADDGTRTIIPTDHVEGQQYEGQLFATVPGGKVTSGDRLAAGNVAYVATPNNEVKALHGADGAELWTFSGHSSLPSDLVVDPSSQTVYSGASGLHALSTQDGSVRWTYSGSGSINAVAMAPDGETVYLADSNNEVHAVNTSDGTEAWVYTGHSGAIDDLAVRPDDEMVFTVSGADTEARAIAAADGSEAWTTTVSEYAEAIAAGPNSEYVYTGQDQVRALNAADGTEDRVIATTSVDYAAITVGENNEKIFVGAGADLVSVGISSGATETVNTLSNQVATLAISPGQETIYAGTKLDTMHAIDPETGTENWMLEESSDNSPVAVATPQASSAVVSATFYDAANSEDIDLVAGSIEVIEITDADGNEMDESDYSEPEYDTFDSGEYSKYVEEHTTYQETLYEETNTTIGITNPIDGIFDWLKNFSLFGFPLWIIVAGIVGLAGYNRVSGD